MNENGIDYTKVGLVSDYFESDLLEEDITKLSDKGMLRETYHFDLRTNKLTNVNVPGSNILVINYTDTPEYLDIESFKERCDEALSEYMSNLFILNDDIAASSLLTGLIDFDGVEIDHLMDLVKNFDQRTLSKKDLKDYLTNISSVDGISVYFEPTKITSLFPMQSLKFYEDDKNLKTVINLVNLYGHINNVSPEQVLDDVDLLLRNNKFIEGVGNDNLIQHRKDINNFLKSKL